MAVQWSLVIFTTLTGLAGWMLAGIAIAELKGIYKKAAFIATVIAVVIMAVGGIASVTHLSHPERMLEALNHPTSGIFVEAVLVGISAVFAIIYAILVKREASAGARKAMIILAALFGILLSFEAGSSYRMAAQETWNTFLLPLGYLGTAIPAGLATYALVAYTKREEGEGMDIFPKLILCGGIIAAITAALYSATLPMEDALVLGWILAVVVGGCGSAIFGFLADKKPESAIAMVTVALVCSFVGCLAYRIMMWTVSYTYYNFFTIL